MHAGTGESAFKCDVCKKSFTHSWRCIILGSSHLHEVHIRSQALQCSEVHLWIHIFQQPLSYVVCKVCFMLHADLKEHLHTHTGYSHVAYLRKALRSLVTWRCMYVLILRHSHLHLMYVRILLVCTASCRGMSALMLGCSHLHICNMKGIWTEAISFGKETVQKIFGTSLTAETNEQLDKLITRKKLCRRRDLIKMECI